MGTGGNGWGSGVSLALCLKQLEVTRLGGGGGGAESIRSHHRRQTTQNEKAHDLKVSESPQNLKIF